MTMLTSRLLLAGTAAIVLPIGGAFAQTPREAALEARVNQLEASLAELKAELHTTHAEQQQTATWVSNAEPKIAALEARPTALTEGFNVGGTTIKLNGFIKANAIFSRYDDGDAATGALGKDFYLPQQIPVGGTREGTDYTGHAKQTRLWLTMATPVGKHSLKGHVEFDFQTSQGTQGSQRTTNGYNLALRRGFVNFDNLLVGQEWSNFQYVAALPESTDFIGPSEGTVFVRQMQARYTFVLNPKLSLSISAENPESATITPTSATLVENDDDRMPDFAARLNYKDSMGELSLAALLRQISADNGTVSGKASAWGVSGAGKLLFGPGKRHDIRFMLTYGDGIGRYLGLNFVPDGVFAGTAGDDIRTVKNLAGFGALRFAWTSQLRSTFMASFQHANYPSGIAITPLTNKRAWSGAANLFWSPVKGFDLGVEYRHGERELLNGNKGQLDRLEMAAKYGF